MSIDSIESWTVSFWFHKPEPNQASAFYCLASRNRQRGLQDTCSSKQVKKIESTILNLISLIWSKETKIANAMSDVTMTPSSPMRPMRISVSCQHFFHLSRPWPNNTNHWSMTWDVCWQWTIAVCAVCGRQVGQLHSRKYDDSKEQEVSRKAARRTIPDTSKLKDMLRGRSTAMRNSYWLRLQWGIDDIRSWCS